MSLVEICHKVLQHFIGQPSQEEQETSTRDIAAVKKAPTMSSKSDSSQVAEARVMKAVTQLDQVVSAIKALGSRNGSTRDEICEYLVSRDLLNSKIAKCLVAKALYKGISEGLIRRPKNSNFYIVAEKKKIGRRAHHHHYHHHPDKSESEHDRDKKREGSRRSHRHEHRGRHRSHANHKGHR